MSFPIDILNRCQHSTARDSSGIVFSVLLQYENNGRIISINVTNYVTTANLFDDVESSKVLGGVVLGVISPRDPRRVGEGAFQCKEREESEVAVRHVLVLGAEQKPRHDWVVRVTEHHHYGTQHNRSLCK